MASIADAFNDSMNDNLCLLKWSFYALPVFLSVSCYMNSKMVSFWFWAILSFILLISLLSYGIHNINSNKHEILTFNILTLVYIALKLFLALFLHVLLLFIVGFLVITFVKVPDDIPNFPLIFKCVVWYFLFSIAFTSFLAFSKKLDVVKAYDLRIIYDSSMDILMSLLFFIPQIVIADAILVGFVWYLFFVFKISLNNPIFIYYCSVIAILNISVMASYFAQIAYETIKSEDSEYNDNYLIKGDGRNYDKNKKN